MRPSAKTKGYLPTLDGWRAIAVAGVLLAHAPDQQNPLVIVRKVREKGWLGVNLFFAISGLLICSRLLQEEETIGSISLANFYIRRAFRILPPALAYLIFVAILGFFGVIPFDGSSWFGALFFYRNYLHYFQGANPHNWFTSQFWTLSVEEHFYLILPSILVFLPRFRKSALLLLTLGCYLWMALLFYVFTSQLHNPYWSQRSEFCLPFLLVPALYAILLREPSILKAVKHYLHPPLGLLCGCIVFAGESRGMPHGLELAPAIAIATLFPLLLLSTIHHPGHFVSRFLELPPLKFIGRLSYSLYLWQQLFFRRDLFFPNFSIRYLQLPWVNLFCVILCSLGSYYLVEQPLIRIGQKIVGSEPSSQR